MMKVTADVIATAAPVDNPELPVNTINHMCFVLIKLADSHCVASY